MDDSASLRELVGRLERPVTWNGQRVRALHPFEDQDRRRLEIVSRGEFTIGGLRNRDLPPLLYSAIGRKLRLLRAHHLIRKIPGTHRDRVTAGGRQIATAAIAASNATGNLPIPKAA